MQVPVLALGERWFVVGEIYFIHLKKACVLFICVTYLGEAR